MQGTISNNKICISNNKIWNYLNYIAQPLMKKSECSDVS